MKGFRCFSMLIALIFVLTEAILFFSIKEKKSEKKILSMMDKGVTVLFVSHSLAQVQRICNKAMILENGTIRNIGDVDEIAAEYENMMNGD